jgi:SAM-dependent methyltransferase
MGNASTSDFKTFQDELNSRTWSSASAMRSLGRHVGFSDRGEEAAFTHLLERVRDKPILDLGVGLGRTIPLLSPLSQDYRALDYLPVMVEASRRRHPGVKVEVGDARSLDGYPSDHFGLVSFSDNGIDAVSAVDRRRVLRAIRHVLAPHGLFFFSTLNHDGPSYRERPWRIRVWRTHNPLRYAWRVAQQVALAPLDTANWRRIRQRGERGAAYAVAPLSAYHYGVLAHYTTLGRQMLELEEEGFARDVAVFGNDQGQRISVGVDTTQIDWFNIVAART